TLFLLSLASALLSCDFDGIDDARESDQQLVSSDLEPEDTGTASETEIPVYEDTSSSTDTDYACFNKKCQSDEDCGCMPRTMCPLAGLDFIRNHCMIIDCIQDDPASCPEGTSCISAAAITAGLVDWLCWEV
ncbi:MAG: hypothetical protein MUC50_23845, partial [Myxococcota bacterium]|nr:hypothetical protein [Myxococcota bacterium]